MPKVIGGHSNKAQVSPRQVGAKVAGVQRKRDVYDDQRWRQLRALMLRTFPVCLYCRKAKATLLDHWQPVSTGIDPYDPCNLVAACRPCHDDLTKRFDAAGGIYGNTRHGKDDPRTADFFVLVQQMIDSNAIAKALTVHRRTRSNLDRKHRTFAKWKGDMSC